MRSLWEEFGLAPDRGSPPMAMDLRHVHALHAAIVAARPWVAAEIGSFRGHSTVAFLAAMDELPFLQFHLWDPHPAPELWHLVNASPHRERITIHAASVWSEDSVRPDFVLIDGGHEWPALADLGWALASGARTIALHDTRSQEAGIDGCWGAALAGEISSHANGWMWVEDRSSRPAEWTHRGLGIATRSPCAADVVEAFNRRIAGEDDVQRENGGVMVLTGFSGGPTWWRIGLLSDESWGAYAAHWGFSFRFLRDYDFPKELGHPSWQKLRHLEAALHEYERVLWVDSDTVCTNQEIDIREHVAWDAAVTASADWGPGNGWSAGVMAWKQCPEAFEILRDAMTRTKFKDKRQWDQDALHEVLGVEDAPPRLRVVGRRVLNAVPDWTHPSVGRAVDPWQPGDFLLHASGMALGERLRHMQAAIKGEVVR